MLNINWPPNTLDSHSDQASIRQISLIHGGPTMQLTKLKDSAADGLLPGTTVHLQRSCGFRAGLVTLEEPRLC